MSKTENKSSYLSDRPIIALMYDFDKTLCTDDMQTYTFLPELGIEASLFWDETNSFTREQRMDSVLAYMYNMLRKMKASGKTYTRENICLLGKEVKFFPGLESWFQRIRNFGEEEGVEIQHYIISSGLKEIIEGTSLAKEFKAIFASEFHYDCYGAPDWPLVTVNYTGKTQYLFRINKGILDISDDRSLNNFTPEYERKVPFRNMIYIGDGMTDVPCMKLVKSEGGVSIAVHNRDNYEKISELLRQGRVSYLMPADYREGQELEGLVKDIIRKMAVSDRLIRAEARQLKHLV